MEKLQKTSGGGKCFLTHTVHHLTEMDHNHLSKHAHGFLNDKPRSRHLDIFQHTFLKLDNITNSIKW